MVVWIALKPRMLIHHYDNIWWVEIKKPRITLGLTVLEAGLEPARPKRPQDFKSGVSTNSTTRAWT